MNNDVINLLMVLRKHYNTLKEKIDMFQKIIITDKKEILRVERRFLEIQEENPEEYKFYKGTHNEK